MYGKSPYEPRTDKHNRMAFSCGAEALDRYLQKQAGQDVARHAAAVFVLTPDGKTVAGFYTLSAHVISLAELPTNVTRSLPGIPAFQQLCWGS